MPRSVQPRPVQSTVGVRKIQDSHDQPARQALDLLVIDIGDDNSHALRTWKSTCKQCQMRYGHLNLDSQAGHDASDKLLTLMTVVTDWKQEGKVDGCTLIKVLTHGEIHGSKLELSDKSGDFVIEDAALFTKLLRAKLGNSPERPWEGVIYLAPCGGAILRKDFKREPGHTFILSGYKSVRTMDLIETFDYVLRAWSAETRSSEAPDTEQVRRLWDETRKHCGEHIAWCGGSKVRTHKAGNFDFANRPLPEKRTRVLYAKLEHGSVDGLKRVVGPDPIKMLKRHRMDYLPLAAAAAGERESAEKLEFLIASGQQVNEQSVSGKSALHYAADSNNLAAAQTLLQHGAHRWLRTGAGDPAWHKATDEVLKLLIADPAAIQATPPAVPDADAFPLHAACATGNLKSLIRIGPNAALLRARDQEGNTALGVALLHGHLKIAEKLLLLGADPNVWLGNGDALLAHAVLHGQPKAASLLLKHGASPHRSERQGMPLLLRAMHAVHAGRANTDLLDLVSNTPEGKQSLQRDLPVHYACHLNNPDLVTWLRQNGADMQQVDGKGRSVGDLIAAHLDS